jgi:hypothetical protein
MAPSLASDLKFEIRENLENGMLSIDTFFAIDVTCINFKGILSLKSESTHPPKHTE